VVRHAGAEACAGELNHFVAGRVHSRAPGNGHLQVSGRRIDASAPPARDTGFQPTYLEVPRGERCARYPNPRSCTKLALCLGRQAIPRSMSLFFRRCMSSQDAHGH
jgi:hypothetical protein